MARLRWNSVAAPDFSTSLEGIRAAGRFLNQGLGAAKAGLTEFDNDKDEQENAAFSQALLKYQDTASLQEALAADPTLGFNGKRLSAETLQNASKRTEFLLDRAGKQQSFDGREYKQNQLENYDAQASLLADLRAAQAAGDANLVRELSGQIDYSSIGSANVEKSFDHFQDARNQRINSRGEIQRQSIAGAKESDRVEDRDDLEQGRAAAFEINSSTLTPNEQRAALEAKRGSLSAAAYNVASNILNSGTGGVRTARATASGTNDNPYDVVLGNGKYGSPAAALSSMTIDDVISFGKETLIPASKADGVGRDERGLLGSSAVGAYQITSSTLAQYGPKVLGADWKNQKFDAETQDKLAEAIFNDNKSKGAGLSKTWASLSPEQALAVSKMPWEKARVIIGAGESGATAASLDPVARAAATSTNISRINSDGQAQRLKRLDGDTSSHFDMAEVLAGTSTKSAKSPQFHGRLKGVPATTIAKMVKNIRERSFVNGEYTLNNAQAAEILANNLLAESDDAGESIFGDSISQFFGFGRSEAINDDFRLDDEGIRNSIRKNKKGTDKKIVATGAIKQAESKLINAEKILNQAASAQRKLEQDTEGRGFAFKKQKAKAAANVLKANDDFQKALSNFQATNKKAGNKDKKRKRGSGLGTFRHRE